MIRNIIERKLSIQMKNKNKLFTYIKLWYEFNFNIKKIIKNLEEIKYEDLMLVFGLLYNKKISYHKTVWSVVKIDDVGHKILSKSKNNTIIIYVYIPNRTGDSYIDIKNTDKNTNTEYKTGYWYKDTIVQDRIKKITYEIIKRYYKGKI